MFVRPILPGRDRGLDFGIGGLWSLSGADCKAKWVKWVSLQPVRAYGGLVPYLLVNVPMSCPVLFPSGAPLERLRIYLASRTSKEEGSGFRARVLGRHFLI